MSQVSLAGDANPENAPKLQNRMVETPVPLWDKAWVWASEKINPIVIKEVRQSLKSRQFTVSFGLTLIAAVAWTLIAISLMVPRLYYMPGGMTLLSGFFCILTLPLMVIIPFSAFRSLTAETEDSTFELLSISALSASQIVYGKMASAGLQIILYLSALAPCIVLTYLLRGVSLFTVLFFLGLTVVFSIAETALALMLASISRTRMVQNGVSVLVLAALLIGFFAWISLILAGGMQEMVNPPKEVYLVLFAIGTVVALIISLVLRAAAASIDFPSENHSTPLRVRIVAVIGLSLFWTIMGIVASKEAFGAVFLMVFVFVLLMILGALMTGELGVMSPRAQRKLPRTFVGRMLLTWLYPGAGLGYVYLICLYASVVITLISIEIYYESTVGNLFGSNSLIAAGYLLLCYLAIYLGLNRMLLMAISKQLPGRMVGSVAVLSVMLILTHLLPLLAVYYWNDYREFDYGWHQAFNIPWSVTEALDRVSLDIGASIVIVTLCAIGIFGLNLVLCTRDVMLVRVAQPPRVRQEDQQIELQISKPDPFAPGE